MVYFIQCQKTGIVKIGYAKQPKKRLKVFQTGYPFDLKLVAVIEGDRSFEHQVHLNFKACRVRGEWFIPSLKMADWILNEKNTKRYLKRSRAKNIARELRKIRERYVLDFQIDQKFIDLEKAILQKQNLKI